jgi:hypothetical protein
MQIFSCAFDSVDAYFETLDNFTPRSAARMPDFHDQTRNRFMKRAVKEKQTICAIIFQSHCQETQGSTLVLRAAVGEQSPAKARNGTSTYAS